MNILIIGSGGREHALGWKLKQSTRVKKIFFAPGNGGTAAIGENISVGDNEELVKFAKKNKIDLTVVGTETPLAEGIVDLFISQGLRIFGPTRAAARLESSKAWAVRFMKRHKIPHPSSHIFSDFDRAQSFINKSKWSNFVIKADGLAAGKGVILTSNKQDATDAAKQMMIKKIFGQAGEIIVIQEKLSGYEVSVIAFADGKTTVRLLPTQDHKRAYDHDRGANTGGMGTYAPVPFVKLSLLKQIDLEILKPLIAGMKRDGHPYQGIIYPGIMVTRDGPKVLEFNVRFGDPETQPQMMLLKSDLTNIMDACIDGKLSKSQVTFKKGAALCVILASGGYPGSYKKGFKINGLQKINNKNIVVFHAGTKSQRGKILTDGGRVLGVTAYGKNLKAAKKLAYQAIGKKSINFDGMMYRSDIAYQSEKIK